MNLASMRTKFKTVLAGLAEAETDASIDEYLNGAYQYRIPDRVPGELTEGTASIPLSAGSSTADYPDTLHSYAQSRSVNSVYDVATGIFYDATVYIDPRRFWYSAGLNSGADSGRPVSILLYNRRVWLHPTPESGSTYLLALSARLYRDPLDTTGVANRTMALATVYGGAMEYAEDLDLDDPMAKLGTRYEQQLKMLVSRSLTRGHGRRALRTF